MNEIFDDFERELQQLAPKQPTDRLKANLALALQESKSSGVDYTWPQARIAQLLLAMAAGLLFTLVAWQTWLPALPVSTTASTNSGARMSRPEPIRLVDQTRYIWKAVDEGIVYLKEQPPLRKVRCQYIDSVRWQNPKNNLSVDMATPVEEVIYLPVLTY